MISWLLALFALIYLWDLVRITPLPTWVVAVVGAPLAYGVLDLPHRWLLALAVAGAAHVVYRVLLAAPEQVVSLARSATRRIPQLPGR